MSTLRGPPRDGAARKTRYWRYFFRQTEHEGRLSHDGLLPAGRHQLSASRRSRDAHGSSLSSDHQSVKSLQPCESVTIAKPHRASDVLHHLQNHELVASKCEYLEHRLHTSLVTGSQLERDELAPGVAALLEQIGIHRAQPVIVRVLGNLLQQPPLPTEVKIGHSLRSCDLGPIRYGAARDQLLPWRALVAAARARRVQGPRRPGTIERHYLEGVGRIDQGADVWPLDAQSVDVPTKRPMSMEELPLPAELAFTQSAPWIDGLAMAHTSEETRDAAKTVPKGIVSSVVYSVIFGYILICTFVLVLPDIPTGVKNGFGFFAELLKTLPSTLQLVLGLSILLVNYLCGLACLTSTSRMMFAFARVGGLPASAFLRKVDPTLKTPVAAVWVSAILAIAATLYAAAFSVLAVGCAVFLYISYIMPTAAGILAEGKTWKHKGPFDLGGMSKLIGVLAVIGGGFLVIVGIQPPNEKVLYLTIAMLFAMAIFWFVFGESKRFKDPPAVKE